MTTKPPYLTEVSARPLPARCLRGWTPWSTPLHAAEILLAMLLAGCQSTAGNSKADVCTPVVGMSTAQLAECGCFAPGTQARYAITEEPEEDARPTQRIAIVTYFCPLNVPGIARVMVTNGIATEVFR